MKINKTKKSAAEKLLSDNNLNLFNKSLFLKVFKTIENQNVSLIFFILSMFSLLYKAILVGTFIDNYNFWFIFLILAFVFCKKSNLKSFKPTLFLIGFIFTGLLSAVFASFNEKVSIEILMNGIFLSFIFPLFFIISSTFTKKYYNKLILILILICLPLLLAGLFQFFSGVQTPQYWVSDVENLIKIRIFGWSENPNNLGSIAMITGLLSLFSFWQNKKLPYIVYAILAITVTILTFSRASWFGWLIALGVVMLIKNWRSIILLILPIFGLLIPSVRQRIFAISDPEYLRATSLDGRGWAIGSIMDIFKSSPIIGSGPGTYGNSFAQDYISPVYSWLSQNGFIATYMVDMQWPQILCQYGLLGVISVVGFFFSYAYNMLKKYFESKNFICLTSVAILVVMLFVGFFENVWFFAPIACLYGTVLGAGVGYATDGR